MATLVMQTKLEFEIEECYSCHVQFAVPMQMHVDRLADKKTFYCPNGHAQSYMGKSLQQQLEDEKKRVRDLHSVVDRESTRAAEAEKKLLAAKADAKRVATRSSAGVCTCCNRTFKQLAAHMKNKHPEQVQP